MQHEDTALSRAAGLVRWLPLAAAAAYLLTVAVLLRGLVRGLYWNSDPAGTLVLAERLRGSGTVSIPHYGSWTTLWYLLATRDVPGHRRLWELTGVVFLLAGAALLGWATARVAGRWGGALAAATTLVVGPAALRGLLALNWHAAVSFTCIVLAAYLVGLGRRPSWPATVAVGVLVGLNAASDPLLVLVGVLPFACAALVLLRRSGRREVGVHAAAALGVAVVCGAVTLVVMRSLGYVLVENVFGLAHAHDIPHNVPKLARFVALLGGANYAIPGGGYPRDPLRIVVAALTLAAVAALVLGCLRLVVRRASSPLVAACACYWGILPVFLAGGFVLSRQGALVETPGVFYTLALAPALGAGLVLVTLASPRARMAVALGVTLVAAVNVAGVANGRAGAPPAAIRTYGGAIVRTLERERATSGYAGYFDSHSLAWQSHLRLQVAPLAACSPPLERQLCPYPFFTIRSWYVPKPGRSFLIADPEIGFTPQLPVRAGLPLAIHRFGPLTVYVFRDDLAKSVEPPSALRF